MRVIRVTATMCITARIATNAIKIDAGKIEWSLNYSEQRSLKNVGENTMRNSATARIVCRGTNRGSRQGNGAASESRTRQHQLAGGDHSQRTNRCECQCDSCQKP